MEYVDDSDTNYGWCTWSSSQRLGKETVGISYQKKNRDHRDHSIGMISVLTLMLFNP